MRSRVLEILTVLLMTFVNGRGTTSHGQAVASAGGQSGFRQHLFGDGSPSTLLFSTFLGGSDDDRANALALDAQENVYVAGGTGSADFLTTAEAYDGSYNGSGNAFVSKLTFRHFVYLPLTVRQV